MEGGGVLLGYELCWAAESLDKGIHRILFIQGRQPTDTYPPHSSSSQNLVLVPWSCHTNDQLTTGQPEPTPVRS